MSNGNFLNGSLVMRIWRFDGGSELLGKFQYWNHAADFAKALADSDAENGKSYFYLAVCDYECKTQAFGTKPESS